MVRADVLDAIDVALRIAKGKLEMPFGGVQVLVLGDHFQLAPIVKPEEGGYFMANQNGYTSPWFFDAHGVPRRRVRGRRVHPRFSANERRLHRRARSAASRLALPTTILTP